MEKITLRQIDAALAVETAGSICLAAKHMHVAQPSLSQQIATLEEEVGVKLFDRLPGGTFPTPAGQVFLDRVRNLSVEVATARLASLAAAAAETPEISVGVQHTEHVPRVAAALSAVRAQNPNLRARIQEFDGGQALRDAIATGAVDVGFGVDFGEWQGALEPAFDVDYVLLVPSRHMLADQKEVSLEELASESWVESPALLRFKSVGAPGSESVHSDIAASSATVAESMVAAGLGITFTTAERPVDEKVLRKVRLLPSSTEHVLAAARGSLGPLERALVEAVAAGQQSILAA